MASFIFFILKYQKFEENVKGKYQKSSGKTNFKELSIKEASEPYFVPKSTSGDSVKLLKLYLSFAWLIR